MKNNIEKHKIFGRPRMPTEEKRSVKVAVFLTEAEAEMLKEKCENVNLTLAEFLRRAALNRKVEVRKSVFDAEAIEHLRAAGQNINQTARELARIRKEHLPLDLGTLRTVLERQTAVLHALKNSVFGGSNRN